ncbi:3'5'-cyclic nucleotide phosphodiesterase [Onchocerca flexuosa]|uniref:Phosphodiesterase n=1 Tax=Onchocerca flexuosa TaxID=387005 RepID=A0A238C4M8_9BILA|nr:3'5'-cyclic nucleotide phosphodiesterase [Onchocerca flexuosa]
MRVRKEVLKEMNESWTADNLSGFYNLLISNGNNIPLILYELGHACAQLTHNEMFDVIVYIKNNSYFTVRTGTDVHLKKVTKEKRLPVYTKKIEDYSGLLLGEIHFYRSLNEHDQIYINILCTWSSALIHYAQLVSSKNENIGLWCSNEQQKLNTFLLDVVKSIFQDIVSMDTVIMKVMNFAQKLTNADRSSLFLVDHKRNELYARIFDMSTEQEEQIKINEDGNEEIRFPASKGISGYVAMTGEVLNIEDAYEDPRFNKEIDQKTGYRTRNILCMPIFIRKSVIGVVQMINKADGPFTVQDEKSFETFAVYCGLALEHAKLYNQIRRSEQKYRVALEVLAYHSVCNKEEVKKLKSTKIEDDIIELDGFEFNGFQLTELEKPLYAVYMFRTLFQGKFNYNDDDLIRFVLTVRKNYRQVLYHNWTHGWIVAQGMYCFLRATTIFTLKEVLVLIISISYQLISEKKSLALYVACLCHDLDHRGKNNAYMKLMSSPLASIYSTSVMEHHHFNQSVIILQQVGHNILKSFSSEEYKEILGIIKHCIIATDLAVFINNKKEMETILADGTFSWDNADHRLLMEAILMTGCDLIAAAKSWPIHTKAVKIIFAEFYEQGDAERKNGQEPIAMMDREKVNELPQMQVTFMKYICVPCYELIVATIPECQQLLDRCLYNMNKWQELADEQNKEELKED